MVYFLEKDSSPKDIAVEVETCPQMLKYCLCLLKGYALKIDGLSKGKELRIFLSFWAFLIDIISKMFQ